MGSFSWCYCDKEIRRNSCGDLDPTNGQRMRYGHPGHVLFPKEFGGRAAQIDVVEYDDYGRFYNDKDNRIYDIYNLVADWNRQWLSEHPEWVRPSEIRHAIECPEDIIKHPEWAPKPISMKKWYPFYSNLSLSREEVVEKWKATADPDNPYSRYEYRQIGIEIACYDDDNAALPYPIKIARNGRAVYEECGISFGDPYQGFDRGYY